MRISGVVMKSAVSKPATRLYPFSKRAPIKRSRGRIIVDMPLCNQCTLCMLKCPTGAITVDKANKTWQIDRLRCVLCGVCAKVCMRKAVVIKEAHAGPVIGKKVEIFKTLEDMTVWAWGPAGGDAPAKKPAT